MKSSILLTVTALSLAASTALPGDIKLLLPRDNDARGWVRSGDVRIFANQKLWEYIDGGADVYLDFGFLQVATVELENGKRNIVVDVYEFKTPEGAFGMYARERAPTYHFGKFGAGGYHEGVALNFHQGAYYVKLTAFTDDTPTKQAMPKIAEAISRKIGGPKKPPQFLARFPAKGKETNSETYEKKAYLDLAGLREAWTARYAEGGRKWTLFLCDAGSAASARARFQGLRSGFTGLPPLAEEFEGLGESVIAGRHREAKETVVVLKGKYIAGIHPAEAGYRKAFLQTFLSTLK